MSKELKALAEAATPGPWGWDGPVWGYDAENEAPWLIQERGSDVVITGEIQCSEANAAYISAADPATVLSLIAERDALLAERDRLAAALDEIGGLCRALRQGGPDPMDLDDLSNALEQAVDTAHAALQGSTPCKSS